MPTDDVSTHAVQVEAGTKRKMNWFAFNHAFLTIASSLLAGMQVARGVQHYLLGKSDWPMQILMGLFYLVASVFWVSRLIGKPRESA
jgi:hypothetical protein